MSAVNPDHYRHGKIEVWDFIVDQDMTYLIGNAVKYLSRYRFKGHAIEDLKKALAYINKQIEVLEVENPPPRH